MNRGRALGTIAVAACLAAIAACSETAAPTPEATGSVALANPAAEHCAEQGGRHVVETAPTGDAFGVCYFEDNRQCEAWALLRGECRSGGIRVTGYATAAGRYCARSRAETMRSLRAAAPRTSKERACYPRARRATPTPTIEWRAAVERSRVRTVRAAAITAPPLGSSPAIPPS